MKQYITAWLLIPALIGGSAGAIYRDIQPNPPVTSNWFVSDQPVLKDTKNVSVYKPPVKKKPAKPVVEAPVAPAPAPTPPKPTNTGNPFVDRLNKLRVAQGLSQVHPSDQLSADSQAYANTMSKRPCDKYPLKHSGVAGEVIACQCGGGFSDVLQAWMDSPGHRAILMSNFTYIGYGQVSVSGCTYYVARVS